MANIVIQDLDVSAELDQQAMRKIVGGRASTGLGLLHTKPQSLLDRRSFQSDALLTKIGLGIGILGRKDAL